MLDRFKNSTKNKINSGGSGVASAEAHQSVTAAAATAAAQNQADGLEEFGMSDLEGSDLGIYESRDSFDGGGGGEDMMNFGDFDPYNMNGLDGVGGDEYGTNAYDDGAFGAEDDINFNSYDDEMGVSIYDSSVSMPSAGLETGFDSSGDPTGAADGNDGGYLQVHHGQSGTTVNVKDGEGNGSTMTSRLSGLSIQSQNKTGSTPASTKATGGSSHGMQSHPLQQKIVRVGGKPVGHTNADARSFTKGQKGHAIDKMSATPTTIDHDSSFRRVVPDPLTIHKTPRTVPDGGGRNSKNGSSSKSVVLQQGQRPRRLLLHSARTSFGTIVVVVSCPSHPVRTHAAANVPEANRLWWTLKSHIRHRMDVSTARTSPVMVVCVSTWTEKIVMTKNRWNAERSMSTTRTLKKWTSNSLTNS